jgi:arabinose-5-phosphate isomerase
VISGRQVILQEMQSLQRLADQFPVSFPSAVQKLRQISGKIVCSGIGKSGHVAQKLSSTLSSTGSPSFFIHPSEALHGDLGALGPSDALIAFSNSGESVEVLRFVQHSQVQCRIAVTSSPASSLAFCSDEVLLIPHVDEACPMGLAPTASTVMMLALGDALALTLSSLRPFTKEQYKRLHPAGALGHKLLQVEQVMRRPPELLPPTACPKTILRAMMVSRIGCVGLANEQGVLERVVSSEDWLGLVDDGPMGPGFQDKVGQAVLGKAPGLISPTATLLEANLSFQHHACLWVQDAGCHQVLGVLLPEDVTYVREGLG